MIRQHPMQLDWLDRAGHFIGMARHHFPCHRHHCHCHLHHRHCHLKSDHQFINRQHPMLLDWLDRAGHMYEPEDRGAWGDQAKFCDDSEIFWCDDYVDLRCILR